MLAAAALHIALASMAATDQDRMFEAAIGTAVQMCVALSPVNSRKLGSVDPEAVAFEYRAARWRASQTLWTADGVRYLEGRAVPKDELEAGCVHELIEEANGAVLRARRNK